MAINVVVKFIRDSTIWIRAYIYDSDGDLVSPTTSVKVTVKEQTSGDTFISAASMVEASTGIYDYYKQSDSDTVLDKYSGEVTTIDGDGVEAKTSKASFSFVIEAGI